MAGWSTSGTFLTIAVVIIFPIVLVYFCYYFIKVYAEDRKDRIAGDNQQKLSLRMAGLSCAEDDDDTTISQV